MTIDADTGLVEFTPDATQIGEHGVSLQVTDGNRAGTQTFVLEVRGPNVAPIFTSTPLLEATAGRKYYYNANAEDTDELTLSLLAAPVGMTIDPRSGVLTMVAEAAQIGDHHVTVAGNRRAWRGDRAKLYVDRRRGQQAAVGFSRVVRDAGRSTHDGRDLRRRVG